MHFNANCNLVVEKKKNNREGKKIALPHLFKCILLIKGVLVELLKG